ncbi:thioredoxin-like protein [Syncephalastrum racemosum]|uniref:Thioredoxin-like protein n=1 Tax=Syncephalastrum racemosum TaxID=13706 RepID=A0A1X2HCM0_SYNRA|nr:thioredoxin-like protein [Syncephalastrum racemosum]
MQINIKVISDTICPWCFMGKRRLEAAIAEFKTTHPDTAFQVEWHPFQLNPSAKKEPVNKLESYKRKFGEARALEIVEDMKRLGKTVGINYSYGGTIANTLDSHRLIHWANGFGKQNQVVEELFKDYFEREQNIGDLQVLAKAAQRAGLEEAEALRYLESGADADKVQHEADENRTNSINGVPHFIINDKFQFPGAQDSSTFVRFFEKAIQQQQQQHL